MEMIVTTALFVLGTAASVALHLRGRAAASHVCAPGEATCPRCGSHVPAKVRHCPGCGVPMQIFEVVSARVVEASAPQAEGGEHLHAVVRADVCVGCGACVPVCPEPGAIRIEKKLAIVDTAKCKGHGDCVKACPVNGIILGTGAPVHRVEVPDVRPDFQSNVPGLYIAGELGGRGLIKNAINEGRIAAESVARELQRRKVADPVRPDFFDLAIVGSGPAGLSAGLEALRLGLHVVVLEQGTLADSIRKYPRRKLLLAEPVRISVFGDLWIEDSSKEALLEVWEKAISLSGLDVRTGHRVQDITSLGQAYRVSGESFSIEARRVILALGRRGTPRRLGVPGEDLEKVYYDIVEMEAFEGRRVLVVGGGDSAIESAVGLCNQEGTTTFLSYRGTEFKRVKDRNRLLLEEAVRNGKIHLLLSSEVREILPQEVVLEFEGKTLRISNDDVIVRVGGEPPSTFLERLGIRSVHKEIPIAEASDAVPV